MRQVLAVDGGQSAIRVRHTDTAETVEVAGVSRLEGDTISSVATAMVERGILRDGLEEADGRELPDVSLHSADGSPLEGALPLGHEVEPGRYRNLGYVWESAA